MTTVECPICYQEIWNSMFITHCSHTFCLTCIKKWLEQEFKCPVCRVKVYYDFKKQEICEEICEEILVEQLTNFVFRENSDNGYRWMEIHDSRGVVSSMPFWINC